MSDNSLKNTEAVDVAYDEYLRSSKSIWPWVRGFFLVIGTIIMIDSLYLFYIWPNFDEYKKGKSPKSMVILDYQKKYGSASWKPLAYSLQNELKKSIFLVAEDSRFYSHNGFDIEAIKLAITYNISSSRRMLGASTISQQTAKNLFVSFKKPTKKMA